MGRYLSVNLCSSSVNRILESYCKIRYTANLLRKGHCLAKAPLCFDLHRYSQLSPPQTFRLATKAAFKKVKRSVTGSTSYRFLRDFTKEGRHPQTVRFYSSSNKDAFKAKAPVGIFEEAQNNFLLSSRGGCLGQSFNQLSRRTNTYFKRKEVVSLSGNASVVVSSPEYVCRSQRISKSQSAATEQNIPESKDTTKTLKCEDRQGNSVTSHSTQETSGLQLFHISSLVTRFGENYNYVAHHINSVFSQGLAKVKKQENLETGSATREANRRQKRRKMQNAGIQSQVKLSSEQADIESQKTPERLKSSSFTDYFCNPTSAIPGLLGAYRKLGPLSQTSNPKIAMSDPQLVLNRKQADEMTRVLMGSLRLASAPETLTSRVEAFNEHLIHYPSCKEKTAVTLLRQRQNYKHDQELQAALRETLALIGYADPVKGHGIRVLSIDGGGTRGVVPLQILKLLEDETGKKIHQLFDYICGVSTGAVLAFMLGLARFSIEECADMYRQFGSEVFRQNPLVGTVKMGWSHSYYNTETWESILREKLGERVLIKTARDDFSPKVSAVSTVVNWGTSPKAFVFRNYNHKPGSVSRYAGGSGYQMWQAVRASSAAPGYFQEFTLQNDIHQDGGIILNNPCALAVHESRLLWPNQDFQCVLSLGTGRYDSAKKGPATSTSLRAKISNVICSATDTEGVHTLLDDLLAPDVYFRFNPMLSTDVSLDENRPQALDQLQRDTQNYLERNRLKLARLCLVLSAEQVDTDMYDLPRTNPYDFCDLWLFL
uniref:PNPLA domain-containing protein n=1 Tax=Amphilophus citrinellus TaxID=61819 RepID=A0A3Q0QRD3_AMPCI